VVDALLAAGLGGSEPVVVQTRMRRKELLEVKAELERERAELVLDCTEYGQEVPGSRV
jgi:hypothetical protein